MLKQGCLQAVRMLISPLALDSQLSGMRDHVIGYILACGIAHRLNELFSLFDKPQVIRNMASDVCCRIAHIHIDMTCTYQCPWFCLSLCLQMSADVSKELVRAHATVTCFIATMTD